MNKRQKKKLIPKNTDYCYEIVAVKENGFIETKQCPHFKITGYVDDILIDSTGQEHLCKRPIYYCSYMKISSEEDFLLSDSVKICGEKLGKL